MASEIFTEYDDVFALKPQRDTHIYDVPSQVRRRNTNSDGEAFELQPTNRHPENEHVTNVSVGAPEPDHNRNLFIQKISHLQNTLRQYWKKHGTHAKIAIGIVLLVCFHIYLGFAIAHSFQKAIALLVLTILGWIFVGYYYVLKPKLAALVGRALFFALAKFTGNVVELTYATIIGAIAIFLIIDTANDRFRLISLSGLCIYVLVLFAFSTAPTRVQWRPVLWGILLQFILGLAILRWPVGASAFTFLSNQFTAFMGYTRNGTSFVYGFLAVPPPICGMQPVFAFTVIQTVLYFSSVVSLLYYLGVMQYVVKQIAWIMQYTMGTSAVESLNAAANIFLGQTEAPLMIRPYMQRMTNSEFCAAMTSGFATVSGAVFAAYVSFGACPHYLMSASVMNAIGSLSVSKLFYPELEESKCKKIEDLKLEKSSERNVLEAISNGASGAVFLVANILANLLVFLALLAFFDAVLVWLGDMVGIADLTFERLCSYIFFPLAYVMGAGQDTDDVMKVAELMGIKTFLNEFIAYQRMSKYIQENSISPRAQLVATFALCGFSNLSSIGVQLGGFSALCPEKKAVIAATVVRSFIAGSITCFMSACIAGLLTAEFRSCGVASSMANCTCIGNFAC